jgi:exodeoxyribonuclease V alpha subunit
MSHYRFARRALPAQPDVWRSIDQAVAQWALQHGGSPLLALLAGWASFVEGQGDTALDLIGTQAGRHGAAQPDPAALAALRAESLVDADGSDPLRPFVLDVAGRFYLRRNHRDEGALAQALAARLGEPGEAPDAALLGRLFAGDDAVATAAQRAAVAAACGRRLFVLSGGPGTGKTATVLRLLLMRLALAGDAPLRIGLAAPTGKAAQRLAQSLRLGKQQLLARLLPAEQALLAHVPEAEATTLHRLLGYSPRDGRFHRHAGRPLALDLLVLDEASMLDLALLRACLDALPPQAALVLVGDADQLAAVAAGSPLMDLVAVLDARDAAERVHLRHSFRAGRELVALCEAVRIGDAPAFVRAMRAAGERVQRRTPETPAALAAALRDWADALAKDFASLTSLDEDGDLAAAQAAEALHLLGRRQLLCALREGRFGALAAQAAIERRLRERLGVAEAGSWYPGRAVMVVRNDPARGLFNGDVGLCLAGADGRLRVWFESLGTDGQPSARAFAPNALPPHEGAFALTIHKSQGSEYAHVALLLPPAGDSAVLSRQLLYTGLSRARQTVELWGSEAVLEAALARPVQRSGGLADRILAALAAT